MGVLRFRSKTNMKCGHTGWCIDDNLINSVKHPSSIVVATKIFSQF